MNQSKLQAAATIAYAVVTVLFVLFFLYMGFFEHVSIQETRALRDLQTVDSYTTEEIADPSAPIGVRTEYRWTLGSIDGGDTTLAFYLVHQYAEVYIDDTLIFRLLPQETNRIGKSISSNWGLIPLYPSDSGKEIRVIITPVYESFRDRTVEFQIGSTYKLLLSQLSHDLPQLLLSFLCIFAGLSISVLQGNQIRRKRSQDWSIFYLGNFTAILGLWKGSDTRFSAFLFQENAMLLGYLSIGALFLTCIPLGLFLHSRFSKSKFQPMLCLSVLASGISLIVLLCQVLGIADFRQMLPLGHLMIILLAITLLVMVLLQRRSQRRWSSSFYFLLLSFCVLTDMVLFYVTSSSYNLMFTMLAFLICTVILFITSILEINKRAFTDAHTGLFNRSRWNALLDKPVSDTESVAMIMIDLNGLKHINDTMGHDAGDAALVRFANILRNTIPPTNTICRWGGDEFAAMISNADRALCQTYLARIHDAVEAYNASGEKPELSYAAGFALSTEFPGLSCQELLKKADERMYRNKQQWYQENTSRK